MGRGERGGGRRRLRRQAAARAEQSGALGTNVGEMGAFLESRRGARSKLAGELWDRGMVGYSSTGQITVKPEGVHRAASNLIDRSRSSELPVSYIRNQYRRTGGRRLGNQAAENRYNAEAAREARAVLGAARVGKVKLTPAQKLRLHKIERGGMLDLQYAHGNVEGTATRRAGITGAAYRRRSVGYRDVGARNRTEEARRLFRTEIRQPARTG